MYVALQVVAVLLVSIAMAMSMAHALEFPGKMRLNKDQYLAIQPIYYPGFTIGGGIGEGGGMLATIVLMLSTPSGTIHFWLISAALVSLIVMHALYWILTHPVNKFWVKDTKLSAAAQRFVDLRGGELRGSAESADWTVLRDRWEWSHVWRAIWAMVALTLLVLAVAL